MADKVIRYVEGGHVMGTGGKARWVYAYVGYRIEGTYKGYTRKPEDTAVVLYPYRINDPRLVPARKHVVSVFDIKAK